MDFFAEILTRIFVYFSSSIYLEALDRSRQLDLEGTALSTQQRIHARAKVLEIAATAAHVFALVQHTKVGRFTRFTCGYHAQRFR